jgi:hypothetical protein
MDEILSKKHYRQTFYIVLSLVLLVALLLRFFFIPEFEKLIPQNVQAALISLLDNLVTSIIVTVFIGSFVFWLRPEIVKRSAIEIVEPKQISHLLKEATLTSKFWIYKGACGRYTRATTFPKLAEAARNDGIGRDIAVYLLDPRNKELCTKYATYRKSLKSGKKGKSWSCKVVQEEIISTAISTFKYQSTEPLLRIKLFFVNSFSAFRFDISEKHVIVTKEEKEACALRADVGTYFYDSYKDDIRLIERQAEEFKCCGEVEFQDEVTMDKLKEIIKCSRLKEVIENDDLDLEVIRMAINAPSDPY